MKYREVLLEQVKTLPYFDKNTLSLLSKQYHIKEGTVDTHISRSLARKDIIQLKRGIYTTDDFYEKNIGDISYKFYLANILRAPSYVSSWTALQYYDLTTDVIGDITSVTPKITRTYRNKAGSFVYHSMKEKLFSGFSLVKGRFNFFIASPSKALVDLLYLGTHQFRGVSLKEIKASVEELRIDIGEMDGGEQAKFYAMIKKYLHHE